MTKDYLKEYDASAEADKYPLVQKWMKTEPLPFFKQLRAERPILVTPECTLLALFTDVRDCLQMPKIFTVDLYKPKMGVTDTEEGYLMAHDDDALHYREKSIMQGMLNRDDIPKVREGIRESAQKILKDANGQLEIVNHYCRMVPAIMVQEYFGLDGINRQKLLKWSFWNQYNTFHNQPFDLNSKQKYDHIVSEHNKCSVELVDYMKVLIVRKWITVQIKDRILGMGLQLVNLVRLILKKQPIVLQDDIVKRMLRSSFAQQVNFPLTRIGTNAGGLLIGAVETTSQAVAQVIHMFINDPALYKQAKAASIQEDNTAIDALVWEALRFVPISPYMFRQASQDYTIAKGTERETTITKGTNVLTLTQSAMFDNYVNDNPDEFNPNRNWYHNFNYGFASHDCLGKYVGMAMIPEMVKQIMRQDNLTQQSEMDYEDGPFPEKYILSWG
ncbi:cytochrome P450 [Paraglaciecola aquimarina]|uniref:Cytochrome P450 n=1 Tax=Paraglaciecola algarum TaxID=3050085 RepID=A0ABS9D2L2_9ALTE|nr:cytochrome P450 [Paraglaciecola sp. G1-23]MCF2947121.1 cytochrome P450 [Paraglaciecola sp. G1-23]